jgi:hypothetical protein
VFDRWLHLGFTSLNPWIAHVMQVRQTDAPAGEPDDNPQRVYVASAGHFTSLHKAMEDTLVYCDIQIRFWVLEQSQRNIGEMVVDVVPLVPLIGHAETIPIIGAGSRARTTRAGDTLDHMEAPEDEREDFPIADDDVLEDVGDVADSDAEFAPDVAADLLGIIYEDLIPPLPPPAEPLAPHDDELIAEVPVCEPSAAVIALAVIPLPVPAALAIAAPVIRPVGGRRGAAAAELIIPSGVIRVYISNDNFVAECRLPGHDACIMTRKRHARPGTYPPRGGRPLGYLLAWLERGADLHLASKAEHWDGEIVSIPHDERAAARASAWTNIPGMAGITMYERNISPGEPDEPELL